METFYHLAKQKIIMNNPYPPKKYALAYCSRGYLGYITHDDPQVVTYPDGNSALAWVGIQLTDKAPFDPNYTGPTGIGAPWSSRHPVVVGYLDHTWLDALHAKIKDDTFTNTDGNATES